MQKHTRKPISYRKAINEMCKGCIYDPLEPGTWRKQVENCTITLCPLYPIRPKSKPDKSPEMAPEMTTASICGGAQ